jgi:competence protein ComEC
VDFHGYLQRFSPTLHRWVGYGGQRVVITRSSPSGYATARTTSATGFFAGLIHGRNIVVTASWIPSFAGSSVGSTVVNAPVVGPGDRVDTHTAPIKISRIYYDPPGVDATNINGEHIMLLNIGDRTANLNGWSVRPRVGPYVYTFTTNVFLRPGQNVTIFSGKGQQTAVHFFWGTHASIWGNSGGAADLRNDLGAVADSCSWTKGPGYTSC